ncbi:hypothetical protein [Bacillus pseudomycoides]|uniref:hypothetical protein n=1 Tax=Bacillus pseudomycoides TaxID=64104 RepID=UPI003D64885D
MKGLLLELLLKQPSGEVYFGIVRDKKDGDTKGCRDSKPKCNSLEQKSGEYNISPYDEKADIEEINSGDSKKNS